MAQNRRKKWRKISEQSFVSNRAYGPKKSVNFLLFFCSVLMAPRSLYPNDYKTKEEIDFSMKSMGPMAQNRQKKWRKISEQPFKIFWSKLWVYVGQGGCLDMCNTITLCKGNRLRRDDTFSAKIQENETCVPFLYCHSIDIADRPNKVYILYRVFLWPVFRVSTGRQQGLVSVQNLE